MDNINELDSHCSLFLEFTVIMHIVVMQVTGHWYVYVAMYVLHADITAK